MLSASKCPFVAGLFPPLPEETIKSLSKSSKFSSIGSRFKLQLQQLMETLNSTEPHYIRCVKPNNLLQPAIFENASVMQQLRCGGVLEAIRISCAGYPTRKTFSEFLHRFGLLAPEVLDGNEDERVACQMILEKMGLSGYQLGATKIFLRADHMAELDARRAINLVYFANSIQKNTRTYIARRQFITLLKASICLQAVSRGKLARDMYINMKRKAAGLKIQKNVRSHFARVSYARLQFSVLVVQTGMRAMAARNELNYRKRRKGATVIQCHWRGHISYSDYKKLKRASIGIGCMWRGRVARKEFQSLKMTASEGGTLEGVKDELEKQVEELTHCLELEKRLRSDLEVAKEQEIATLQLSLQHMQINVDETNELRMKEQEAARKAMEEVSSIVTQDVDVLGVEVEYLKTSLDLEKERADDCERRCAEALKSSEERRTKLEETERRVHQLQEMLNRMIYCMADQFSELKMILSSSSNSCSTSGIVTANVQINESPTSSDTTSTDSDFTFPCPASTSPSFSSLRPNIPQLIVEDHSVVEASESDNWEGDKEGSFDDFF